MNKNEKELRRLRELGYGIYIFNKLRKISKQINNADTHYCNGDYTEQQHGIRLDRLMRRAQILADNIGFLAYHQSDPRGCSLYLITKQQHKIGQYSGGLAIC